MSLDPQPSTLNSVVRPSVAALDAYTPGEQPRPGGRWVKLNTNELPHGPSPRVVGAIAAAAAAGLNRYPDPLGTRFREAAAARYGVEPDWVLPANGSDENLTLLIRTFADAGETIASPYPSYTLYRTLAEIQGCRFASIPLRPDWAWDLDVAKAVMPDVKLLFVPCPNSPSGTVWRDDVLAELVPPHGLLVLDGAYADFHDPHAGLDLLRGPSGDRIVLTRTLSKSYGLAGLRFGFAIARPAAVAAMRKVKDSYNCDALALAAATAAIGDVDWLTETVAGVRRGRQRLTSALRHRGFATAPGGANFVWATHPDGRHRERYEALKSRGVLVRYFRLPDWDGTPDGLRITVGSPDELDALFAALDGMKLPPA